MKQEKGRLKMGEISFGWMVVIGIAGAVLGRIVSRFIALRKERSRKNQEIAPEMKIGESK